MGGERKDRAGAPLVPSPMLSRRLGYVKSQLDRITCACVCVLSLDENYFYFVVYIKSNYFCRNVDASVPDTPPGVFLSRWEQYSDTHRNRLS